MKDRAELIQTLTQLYNRNSKHSNYQNLTPKLKEILNTDNFAIKSRFEKERFDYIINNIYIQDKYILDIGGNTGYFTFQAIDNNAKHVDYYEGYFYHSQFVKLSAELLNCEDKIDIFNEYFNFDNIYKQKKYDIIFLLNVLHHIGDDFYDNNINITHAKNKIIEIINEFTSISKYLILQIGYNWKGNINFPLFENGTKKEMINYIINGIKKHWIVLNIGVAEKENDKVVYKDLNDTNINREDTLGEFLNRPLFIVKCKNEK